MIKMRRFVIYFFGFIIAAVLFRFFFVAPYVISDQEMEDTIYRGDYILINKGVYWLRAPKRDDIIVFDYPQDARKVFIKRIIGTPGDVVECRDKEIFINGKVYLGSCVVHKDGDIIPREQNPRDSFGPVTVPYGAYFVMGDNRDHSWDSRFWGVVKKERIKGKAFIKYWSWDAANSRVRWDRIGKLVH